MPLSEVIEDDRSGTGMRKTSTDGTPPSSLKVLLHGPRTGPGLRGTDDAEHTFWHSTLQAHSRLPTTFTQKTGEQKENTRCTKANHSSQKSRL